MGIEYQIWRNKYGLKDIDEDVAQAMIKWIFDHFFAFAFNQQHKITNSPDLRMAL